MKASPAVLATLRQLWRRPTASRTEIEAFRDARLRELVRHAYARVPYYRELFDRAGVRPEQIRGAADLERIPVSAKEDLRARPVEEIVARGTDLRRIQSMHTSGTTAAPFTVRKTPMERRLQRLYWIAAMRELGISPWDRIAQVVRLDRAADGRQLRAAMRMYGSVKVDLLLPPAEVLARLERADPSIIIGYPGALARVAEYAKQQGESRIRPRLIVTGAEVLTPLARRFIAEGFGARVAQWYASWELGLIGWSCPTSGLLHTCDDGVILEVLRDDRAAAEGESGEVVGTNLSSFAMPMIRYRLRDVTSRGPGQCECGRPFGVIGEVQGRTFEYFSLPDGRVLHPFQFLRQQVLLVPWVAQIQLAQERLDSLRLRIVPSVHPSPEELSAMHAAIMNVLGSTVTLHIELVESIPLEASGKYRAFLPLATPAGPAGHAGSVDPFAASDIPVQRP